MGLNIGEIIADDRTTAVPFGDSFARVQYRPLAFSVEFERELMGKMDWPEICEHLVVSWDLESPATALELAQPIPVDVAAMVKFPKIIFQTIALHIVGEIREGKARPETSDPGSSPTD